MKRWSSFFSSTIGKKIVVGVTGLAMIVFLIGHVSGNLKVFLPDPEPGVADIDVYASFLRSMGEPLAPHGSLLWLVRIGLLAALVLHVVFVIQLSARNRAARPQGYAGQRYTRATWAARLMMYSGLLLLIYVVVHVLHFTTGTVEPSQFEHGAVYANLYNAFVRWPWVAAYIVAMAFVAVHLYHGAWSVFQTLGLDHPDRNRLIRLGAALLALVLFLGFVSVPLAFITGVLGPPPGGAMASSP